MKSVKKILQSLRAKRSNLIGIASGLRSRKDSGQAAIEFIIVVVVVFFFLLFYLSLCMGMVLSEYVEYATFMTARTYKAAYVSEGSQREYADRAFRNYFYFQGRQDQPKIPETLLKINGLQFDGAGPRGDQKTAGVRVDYEVPFFYLPPIFLPPADQNSVGNATKLNLTAESYLGREPTLNEVKSDLSKIVQDKKLRFDSNSVLVEQMDDNGY